MGWSRGPPRPGCLVGVMDDWRPRYRGSCSPESSSPALLCAVPSGFQLVQSLGPCRSSGEEKEIPGYSLPRHPPCLATAGRCVLDQGPEVLSGGLIITASGFRPLRPLPRPDPGPGTVCVPGFCSSRCGFSPSERHLPGQ